MTAPDPNLERIRAALERLRSTAAPEAAQPPDPPRHWQELAEEREPAAPTRLQLEAGELAARETACARLRKLLADGEWHSALELAEVGGLRYGGRLFEIRRGEDGAPPLDVEGETREHGGRLVWWYRAARAAP